MIISKDWYDDNSEEFCEVCTELTFSKVCGDNLAPPDIAPYYCTDIICEVCGEEK
jgi:hypothetical protein